jgi:hypothetical protein
MKRRYGIIVLFAFLCAATLQAQFPEAGPSPGAIPSGARLAALRSLSLLNDSATAPLSIAPRDSTQYNMYGDLRDDNPEYNSKSPIWSCALRVAGNNIVTWAVDRFVSNAEYARVSPATWKENLRTGPEWDVDRFGMNYFFHPYSGAGYFNASRANGYSFYESLPLTFAGSLMWEYFGENTAPAVNDLINTTVTGALLGEIAYKLSSDFLDDRTTGSERVFRELFAGIINPSRAFSRIIHGHITRVTNEEIYHKEPLNMMFTVGAVLVNEERSIGTGTVTEMLTLHLDYGNPFEVRSRKPYDYFTLRANLSFGVGRKIINNIIAQALLFGKNTESGDLQMLFGGFQHYDFWDNKTFELGTIAFGPGLISRLQLGQSSILFYDLHAGIIPLAGNSGRLGPDTSQFRDYNYGGGLEAKAEATLNLGGWTSLTMRGYYYWIHTFVGALGNNYICIVKPTVTFRVFDNISLGIEHLIYFSDRYPRDFPNVHEVRTEQKLYVQYFVDNFKHDK